MLFSETPCTELENYGDARRSKESKRIRRSAQSRMMPKSRVTQVPAPSAALGSEMMMGTKSGDAAIDRAHLARYTMGDLALENEILGLFATQLPCMLRDILGANNKDDLMRAAHTLKGSARAIGAWALAEAAQKVEEIATADTDVPMSKQFQKVLQRLNEAGKSTQDAISACVAS
ncbi:MAG: Hpt domain-containing protein [Pseudomonadota bacterium]